MGLFDKKYCDVCGEKIGLLGNRRLSDGNLCRDCARKLSPWFSERRQSTVEDIKAQLAYREENRKKAAQFSVSRSFGEDWRVLLDDTHGWFTVTRDRELERANPDILDYSQFTGCRMDVDENRTELKKDGTDVKKVSYSPPRYRFTYDFDMFITVNSPYFEEMRFKLNPRSVELVSELPRGFSMTRTIDPGYNIEYRKYKQMGDELCQALNELGRRGKSAEPAAAMPGPEAPAAGPWTCQACGGTNTGRFCEYCGSPRSE